MAQTAFLIAAKLGGPACRCGCQLIFVDSPNLISRGPVSLLRLSALSNRKWSFSCRYILPSHRLGQSVFC